jgi:8-oxo-dGTP diphosphatase
LLAERLGLPGAYSEQLYTFGAPDRDPRMRIVTVAYYAMIAPERLDGLAD